MIQMLIFALLFAQDAANNSGGESVMPGDLMSQPIPPLISDIIEVYRYNPEGKRDPFTPFVAPTEYNYSDVMQGPVMPLQTYSLDQLSLVGVIWGGKRPMAMISDTDGKVYYVRQNDKIGNNSGYVARIREGEIVIIEQIFDEEGNANYISRVMKIQKKKKE